MDEQVGGEEEEVGAAETGQQVVEDIPHRPKHCLPKRPEGEERGGQRTWSAADKLNPFWRPQRLAKSTAC